jgi:endonuclease/exonuclease/phosphatase family metal-dependent hydrolase
MQDGDDYPLMAWTGALRAGGRLAVGLGVSAASGEVVTPGSAVTAPGAAAPLLRLMTYNVHSCVGTDGRLSAERIADVIAESAPDIVALQEVDVGQSRSGKVHQGEWIAMRLCMNHLFSSARETDGGHYGNAILSRYPLHSVRTGLLPTRAARKLLEPRVAQWAKLAWGGLELHLVNTHLSLDRQERLAQARALLSSDWVLHPDQGAATLVCGDFNSLPWSRVHRAMRQRLVDARDSPEASLVGTFPSWLPVLRLDHVFASDQVDIVETRVPFSKASRTASDHLPLVVHLRQRAYGGS